MRLLGLVLLTMLIAAPVVEADDRMAGSSPVQVEDQRESEAKEQEEDAPKPEEAPKEKIEEPQEVEPEPPKRPAILNENIRQLESRGLWTTPREGALGRDMWSNTPRALVSDLLPGLPTKTTDPVLQKLRNGLLLTRANAVLLRGNSAEDDIDLFTLRLEKLLEIGAYNHAAALYATLNGKEPYHPHLARAGILTHMLSGEKGLACIEYQSIADRDFSDTIYPNFWHDIALYCDYALKPADDRMEERRALRDAKSATLRRIGTNQAFKTGYNSTRFARYSMMSKAVLKAEGRINQGSLAALDFADIAPDHLGLLYDEAESSPRTKLLLHLQQLRWGLIKPQDFRNFLRRERQNLQSANPKGWQRIPAFYTDFEETQSDEERLTLLREHLYLNKSHGWTVFAPVAPQIRNLDPALMTSSELLSAMRILHHNGLTMPDRWRNHILSLVESDENSSLKDKDLQKLWGIALAHLSPREVNSARIDIFNSILDTNHIIHGKNAKIVIENLDKAFQNNHNRTKVYEKDALQASASSYFLPNFTIWNELRESKSNQRIGAILLVNTLILHELHDKEIYPGLMQDIIESFNTVGLTKLSEDALISAFLR